MATANSNLTPLSPKHDQHQSSPLPLTEQSLNNSKKQSLGRWTKQEHDRFIEGIRLYGKNWKLVEEHIGTRTGAQIRSHAQKFFNRLEKDFERGEDKENHVDGCAQDNSSYENTEKPVKRAPILSQQQQQPLTLTHATIGADSNDLDASSNRSASVPQVSGSFAAAAQVAPLHQHHAPKMAHTLPQSHAVSEPAEAVPDFENQIMMLLMQQLQQTMMMQLAQQPSALARGGMPQLDLAAALNMPARSLLLQSLLDLQAHADTAPKAAVPVPSAALSSPLAPLHANTFNANASASSTAAAKQLYTPHSTQSSFRVVNGSNDHAKTLKLENLRRKLSVDYNTSKKLKLE